MRDVVAARDVAHRSPASTRRSASFLWCGVSFGFRPIFTPARHGAGAAFARPRADQLALELGQPAQHGQHQPPVRGRGVGPCVAEGSEPGLAVGDRRRGCSTGRGWIAPAGRAASPSARRRRRAGRAPCEAGRGRSWLRSPSRGTPWRLRPSAAGAPAPPRSGRPSRLVHSRISWLIMHRIYAPEKALCFQLLILVQNS